MIQKIEPLDFIKPGQSARDAMRRGHLENNVYRNIDAIINRQMELKHRMPKNLGKRKYLHSFSPTIETIVDGCKAEVTFVSRLDFEEVHTSTTGRKNVYTHSHYTILTSEGLEVYLPALSEEALDLLTLGLQTYYNQISTL